MKIEDFVSNRHHFLDPNQDETFLETIMPDKCIYVIAVSIISPREVVLELKIEISQINSPFLQRKSLWFINCHAT